MLPLVGDRSPEIKHTKIFINNEWVDSVSGRKFPTLNPTTGEKIVDVSEGGEADVVRAVKAARVAFGHGSVWNQMLPSERGKLMMRLADCMEHNMEHLASLETLDNGKPFTCSLFDIELSAKIVRFYAGWADKFLGDAVPIDSSNDLTITLKEPVGVVAAIIPWNFPILMASVKLGPALASGCVVILKPSEQTPLTCLYLASLVKEAGFPPGVVQVVPGFGAIAGAALTQNPDVDKVVITGTEQVRQIRESCCAEITSLKRVSLESGGKVPFVVCADSNLEEAAKLAHFALFFNQGQCYYAGSRTYVEESVYDAFLKRATELANARVVGDPYEAATEQGPQIDGDQFNRIQDLIASGKKEGARLMCGGSRWGDSGYFIQTTVFADVDESMRIGKEEILGPVQCIFKFSNLEEVVEKSNWSGCGLAAAIFTKDLNKALGFARRIKAGTVWINCFDALYKTSSSGGYKESGFGREYGDTSLDDYLEIKSVTVQLK